MNFIKGTAKKFVFKDKQKGEIAVKHILSLNFQDLSEIVDEKGYVQIAYKEKDKDKYGNQGIIYENDYAKNMNKKQKNSSNGDDKAEDDLPF